MKVLFCHDHTFIFKGQCGYSYGSYPKSYWNRYLEFSNELNIVAKSSVDITNEVLDTKYALSFEQSSMSKLKFHGLQQVPFSWRLGYPIGDRWERIKEVINKVDVVICRIPSDIGWAIALECIRQKKPYAVEVVGDAHAAYYYRGGLAGKIYANIAEFKVTYLTRHSAAALYVSNKLKKKYPCSDTAISVVATNAVIESIEDESITLDRINRMKKEGYIRRIGLIGSYFVNYKGIDLAIKALANLKKEGVVLDLHILGDGNSDQYLSLASRLGVSENVSFDGLLPAGKPVKEWLKKCDYYMQPSRQEGLPRGLLEALSVRLPAVGSTAGGICEILDEAHIHDVNDLLKLTESMKEMLREDYLKASRRSALTAQDYLFIAVDARRRSFYKTFLEENNENT